MIRKESFGRMNVLLSGVLALRVNMFSRCQQTNGSLLLFSQCLEVVEFQSWSKLLLVAIENHPWFLLKKILRLSEEG